MPRKKIFQLLTFLVVLNSLSLPAHAESDFPWHMFLVAINGGDKDCNGVRGGNAVIDDCGVCDNDPTNDNTTCTVPVTVTSAGQIWMDRNLGASQVATSSTDTAAYGDLYQWGRLADGHEKRSSPTTTIQSATDIPGHGSFILGDTLSDWDWRNPQNDNLWQGVSGTNNPCPAGFRLPTETELSIELSSWGTDNAAGAFASPLKLVTAGFRDMYYGDITAEDNAYYWSSTVWSTTSRHLSFSSNGSADIYPNRRAKGFSVRCIKD